jgi:hypothetical protein
MLYNDANEYSIERLADTLKMKSESIATAVHAIVKEGLLKVTNGKMEDCSATLKINDSFQK